MLISTTISDEDKSTAPMSEINNDTEKKGCLKNDLPDEAFVEFECHQISNIVNVFLNPYFNLTETAAIENFGFAIKDNSEDLEFTEQTKTFLAEKYGGPGILTYGSVRCGYAENFQVKGIDSNLLAGEEQDFWHSHGSLSLVESFHETLSGAVLHISEWTAGKTPWLIDFAAPKILAKQIYFHACKNIFPDYEKIGFVRRNIDGSVRRLGLIKNAMRKETT